MLGEKVIMTMTFHANTTILFQALDRVFLSALQKLKPTALGEIDDG
jgi:hypothetical protein